MQLKGLEVCRGAELLDEIKLHKGLCVFEGPVVRGGTGGTRVRRVEARSNVDDKLSQFI